MNKKNVLIAEDDEFFRSALRTILEDSGFGVLEAPNGKSAREILGAYPCDLVISDMQMPHGTGLELLEWCKANRPLPFVLITGFSHIKETQRAHELGVEGFLSKPFDEKDLIQNVRRCLKMDESVLSKEPVNLDGNYCRVSLEDFISEKDIEMDVFIRLTPSKYVKVAHEGGKLPADRIAHYKEKGITQLYIRKEDFNRVIAFNVKLTKLVAGSATIDQEKKKRFMAHTADVLLENTFVNGIDEKAYGEAKDFLMTSIGLLTEDQQTFDLLDILNSHSDHLYAHSLGVSVYAVMIAKAMDWSSSAALFKLSFGGLMHDIGKKEVDPQILQKSRATLSFKERQILESHATRGKEILETLKSAPSEVVAIAFEHHENYLGQGFPRQISKVQIHPMARIVGVANEFCNYALKGAHNPGVSAEKAISLMENFKKDGLDPVAYKALKNLVLSSGSLKKSS
jgi:putative nucleotidyltransferase with HDIG domain